MCQLFRLRGGRRPARRVFPGSSVGYKPGDAPCPGSARRTQRAARFFPCPDSGHVHYQGRFSLSAHPEPVVFWGAKVARRRVGTWIR